MPVRLPGEVMRFLPREDDRAPSPNPPVPPAAQSSYAARAGKMMRSTSFQDRLYERVGVRL
jgi:hypothetical protein